MHHSYCSLAATGCSLLPVTVHRCTLIFYDCIASDACILLNSDLGRMWKDAFVA
jgi:hypothetical protein